MSMTSRAPRLPSVEVKDQRKSSNNKLTSSGPIVRQNSPIQSLEKLTISGEEIATWMLEPVDSMKCSDEEFLEYLNSIKESIKRRYEIQSKKTGGKKNNKRQMAAILQEEMIAHQKILGQANTILHFMLDEMEERLNKIRRNESLLLEYYNMLEEEIERGDEKYVLHKDNPYHRLQRELRRTSPRLRYSTERIFLESRHEKLSELLQEVEKEEKELALNDNDDGTISGNYSMRDTETDKLEELYEHDGVKLGTSPEARLRLRALKPLLQKAREFRIIPPLPPARVQSRLRKEIILPFSARVLALKVEESNNAGDRFVEWYVNTVIDPLAMSQLVELAPREYLVTTTVRILNACDTYRHVRQEQTFPDVSHVVLQAIAEGRSDAVTSLILSASGSYLRALENKEHVGIIFYAALITGQMEVLRKLISAGFFDTNALIVWLFLNPNNDDSFYTKYINEVINNIKKFLENETLRVQDNIENEMNYSFNEDDILETTQRAINPIHVGWNPSTLMRGMCENLRRFLKDRLSWKKQGIPETQSTSPPTTGLFLNNRRRSTSRLPPFQFSSLPISSSSPTTTTSSLLDNSFSSLLNKKRLDRLTLSPMKCSVLPAISTSIMRRVDALGFTPLKSTNSHLLLVGDVSTNNAHIVKLPSQYISSWADEDPKETMHDRRQREYQQASLNGQGLSFYYEAHISLKFLLSEVPVSSNKFSLPASVSSNSSFNVSENNNSNKKEEFLLPSLQTSTVFVGWCSEERVVDADGRSAQNPLGSDCYSMGISFDVLHRTKIDQGIEEVILRPMKHMMGRTSVFTNIDEGEIQEQDKEGNNKNVFTPLLKVRIEDNEVSGNINNTLIFNNSINSGFKRFSNDSFSSQIRPSNSKLFTPSESSTSVSNLEIISQKETVVPSVTLLHLEKFINERKKKEEGDEEEDNSKSSSEDVVSTFGSSSIVLSGVPVYKTQALVVGCKVNFATSQVSFTVNGTSLGTAFNSLPSSVSLRPAISLQASKEITEILKRENPADAVIVRFVFTKHFLLANHLIMQSGLGFKESFKTEKTEEKKEILVENEKNKKSLSIPGVLPINEPLLFDETITHRAFLRLITGADSTLPINDVADEFLQGDKESLSLTSTLRITSSSVKQLLNSPSNLENMLFFPPVYVKRRSDDSSKEINGVSIIPEDISLVPLCAALALRQRVSAYYIATHPLTDFENTDDLSIKQRRMAILASATLGYEEILCVLLQRIQIFELLALFTIKNSNNNNNNSETLSLHKKNRLFSGGTYRPINSANLLHRVEYTPLHCALLEGHQGCVHLLLYYLNRTLSEEYIKHAVNVLTRSGETALVMACRLGYTKIAKRLLAMGASPASFDRVTRANCLELACASRSEEIALALLETSEYHSHVAVNNAGVASPLCWCALSNVASLIKPLLANGANPNITLDGPTPLLLAVIFGSENAALQLLEWCDASSNVASTLVVNSNSPASQQLRKTDDNDINNSDNNKKKGLAVLDVDAIDPRTQCGALHLACELGQLEVAKALIEKGASLNLQNKSNYANPLQMAIMSGNENLALEILEFAKDKLRRGFNVLDIAAIDKNGNTALHLAAREGMLPVIEYIMSQFSDEEITRLSGIRKFAKRPNAMSVVASNRQGRTPLLTAIYAHQETAAQLIASLTPEYIANPGGPIIDGICMAILASDAEGLDNVTLFFLSNKMYTATDHFREEFFAKYNANRLRMDLQEDSGVVQEKERRRVAFNNPFIGKKRLVKRPKYLPDMKSLQNNRPTHVLSARIAKNSLTALAYAGRLSGTSEHQQQQQVGGIFATRKYTIEKSGKSASPSRRRRSTFVQMLLAKGGSGPSTRKSIQILEKGFAIDELYAMVDIISSETTRTSQSITAMQYAETLVVFLLEYAGIRIALSDAVIFARKILVSPILIDAVDKKRLNDAKQKLLEMRPFCKEMISLIRTRGHRMESVDDMRHMIAQRGNINFSSLTEELTSPFGYTILQLAATLGLPHICEFLLVECQMDPLYVPPLKEDYYYRAMKWFLSPFRLAVRSVNVETVTVFLSLDILDSEIQKLLEHKELPQGDPLQQTALQEIIQTPLDTFPSENIMDVFHVVRLLLRSGAVVHGNFDIEGNDAWILAVRALPRKGTHLQLFFDEEVELEENEEEENEGEKEELEYKGVIMDHHHHHHNENENESNNFETKSRNSGDFETERRDSIVSVHSTIIPSPGKGSVVSLVLPVLGSSTALRLMNSSGVNLNNIPTITPKMKRRAYFVQLIFDCAEYNPQCLVSLLERFPNILSPSVIHPVTGDTLLIFLLRRAYSIYALESANEQIYTGDISREDVFQSTRWMANDLGSNKIVENENIAYRDPITIPAVRSLLLVVEKLLRKFYFNNLYHEQGEGQTALALAANMSYTTIVSLIVCPINSSENSLIINNNNKSEINSELTHNLESSDCWITLATRLYYAEEDMETLLTIVRHLSTIEIKYSFLSMVYSNLHPIVALRVTVLYSNDVKRILIQPEAVNAFWCNILYAQFVDRLEEIIVTPAQWSSLLSVLLPKASAVPIYLIKASPLFPKSSSLDLLPLPLTSPFVIPVKTALPATPTSTTTTTTISTTTTTTTTISNSQKVKKNNKITTNWGSIVRGTQQYVKQLVCAAIYISAPTTASINIRGVSAIPTSQRHVLTPMADHFHEIIELSVRFDNATMLMTLIDLTPEDLRPFIKYEWNILMEKHYLEVIAITAGSIHVLQLLSQIPEAVVYMSSDRYDRIDPNTGFPEDLNISEITHGDQHRSVSVNSISAGMIPTPARANTGIFVGIGGGGGGNTTERSLSTVAPRKFSEKKPPVIRENKGINNNNNNNNKVKDKRHSAVSILALSEDTPERDMEKTIYEDSISESGLQYLDMMTAARERTNASAVTWGIGAAARPVALQENIKNNNELNSKPSLASLPLVHRKKTGVVVVVDTTTTINNNNNNNNTTTFGGGGGGGTPGATFNSKLPPSTREGKRSSLLLNTPRKLQTSVSDNTKVFSQFSRHATTLIEQKEPIRYFAYYLCDWALHSTFSLHAPRPSVRTIDTLMYLMENRAPLTCSIIQIFLAASKPMNHWKSSNDELITLNYITKTHKDSILHILVQNDQVRLTRYFLASALCYFTFYQYDPPSNMPPQFPLIDLPKNYYNDTFFLEKGGGHTTEKEYINDFEEDVPYPAVFLRSMLKINKYGLTPFDYARGSMVSLLYEYGCVPPSYRPNPRGFCRAIRLGISPISFYQVPRLFLVTEDFIRLHDDVAITRARRIKEGSISNIPDTTIQRNQTMVQRSAINNVLPELVTDNVSLLHLGLCSADDELVLQSINDKRQQQLKSTFTFQSNRVTPSPLLRPQSSMTLLSSNKREKKLNYSAHTPSSRSAGASSPPGTRGKNDKKDLPNAMKLLDILQERSFVSFPLLLPILDEMNFTIDEGVQNDDSTAILISMTPMMLAITAGVIKREENVLISNSLQRRRSSSFSQRRSRNSIYESQQQQQQQQYEPIPPRYTLTPSTNINNTNNNTTTVIIGSNKPRQSSAEMLEAWLLTRRAVKSNSTGQEKLQHPHTHLVVKAIYNGISGRTIRALGLSTAPSYEPRK